MKRGDARELAVHLIYGRAFTGEEPEQVVSTRLDKEYYGKLAEENEVYAQRPDRFQLRYIDSVVTGVANREDELDNVIRQFSIGWDISRISKLARLHLCGGRGYTEHGQQEAGLSGSGERQYVLYLRQQLCAALSALALWN